MEILISSINSIIPLLIIITVGYGLGKIFKISDDFSKALSSITFNALIPFHLFNSIYNGASSLSISLKLIVIIFIIEVFSFFLSILFANKLYTKKERAGALFQSVYRSNVVVFGLSIAQILLDNTGATLYTLSLLFIIPMQNFGTVVGIEYYQGKDNLKNWPKIIAKSIINPNIISILLALLLIVFRISLPEYIYKGVSDIAGIAAPLSLILIGAGFNFNDLIKDVKELSVAAFYKLILVPSLLVPIIISLNLTFPESFIIILMLASPTASAVYPAVEQSGFDKSYAKEMIIFTQLVSIITLTLWIYIIQIIT